MSEPEVSTEKKYVYELHLSGMAFFADAYPLTEAQYAFFYENDDEEDERIWSEGGFPDCLRHYNCSFEVPPELNLPPMDEWIHTGIEAGVIGLDFGSAELKVIDQQTGEKILECNLVDLEEHGVPKDAITNDDLLESAVKTYSKFMIGGSEPQSADFLHELVTNEPFRPDRLKFGFSSLAGYYSTLDVIQYDGGEVGESLIENSIPDGSGFEWDTLRITR